MKRLGVLLGLIFFLFGFALAADQIPAGKETIEFKVPLGTVTFQHKVHATTRAPNGCVTCHHTYKAGEAIKACSACHGKAAAGKVPNLQTAVHKTCGDCHKAEIAKGKKAPNPLKCMECHVKPKPA